MSEVFGWLWKEAIMAYGISLETSTKTMKKILSQVAVSRTTKKLNRDINHSTTIFSSQYVKTPEDEC